MKLSPTSASIDFGPDAKVKPVQFAIFFLCVYVLSWLLWLPMVIAHQPANLALLLLGILVPSVLGVAFIYRTQPPAEHKELWLRLSPRRISWRWMLVCILILPALLVAGATLDALAGGQATLSFANLVTLWGHPFQLVSVLLSLIIGGPLAEELGWRGFALDQLQARFNPLVASLVLGIVWACWHIPLFFIPGTFQYSMGLNDFGLFAGSLIALTLVMTWIYNHTQRSILTAILLHFVYNATSAFTADPQHPLTTADWGWRLGVLAAFALIVGVWEAKRKPLMAK
jgi:CAAX protease family protein